MWGVLQSRQQTQRAGTGRSSPATQADHSRGNDTAVCDTKRCQYLAQKPTGAERVLATLGGGGTRGSFKGERGTRGEGLPVKQRSVCPVRGGGKESLCVWRGCPTGGMPRGVSAQLDLCSVKLVFDFSKLN